LLNQDTVDLATPRSAGRLTTIGSIFGMSSITQVPSTTPIVVFGEADIYPGWAGSPRTITNRSKICLAGVDIIQFYVNRGGGGWGDTSYDDLYLEYSYDNSSWSALATVTVGSYTSNIWTLVTATIPAAAKYYNGVYLRYSTQSYGAGSTYRTWAVTSAVGKSNPSLSDDTSTNSTYYPTISTSSSSADFRTSSSKLTYNPSTGTLTSTIVADANGNLRKLPNLSRTSAYTLVVGDVGDLVNITTGGVTVPFGVFSAGDAISIYNNSASSQTITQGGSVTMYLAGTSTTGNRTLAQRGVCTVLCVGSNTFVISGAGLSWQLFNRCFLIVVIH